MPKPGSSSARPAALPGQSRSTVAGAHVVEEQLLAPDAWLTDAPISAKRTPVVAPRRSLLGEDHVICRCLRDTSGYIVHRRRRSSPVPAVGDQVSLSSSPPGIELFFEDASISRAVDCRADIAATPRRRAKPQSGLPRPKATVPTFTPPCRPHRRLPLRALHVADQHHVYWRDSARPAVYRLDPKKLVPYNGAALPNNMSMGSPNRQSAGRLPSSSSR